MKRALGALALIVVYPSVALAPLAFMFVGTPVRPRPLIVNLSDALAFVSLSMMGLQFALVARFRSIAAPFGIDILQRFHKQISFVVLAFILAHPILLFVQNAPSYLSLLVVTAAPWRARFALASLALLFLLVALSVWRRRLRMSYELWQLSHGTMALGVVVFALAHIDGVGYYTRGLARQVIFDAAALSLVLLLIWSRIITPLIQSRRPWRVVRLQPERARSTTLVIRPDGHAGFTFKPGQFAWVSRWPVAITQHPFSFSSPTAYDSQDNLTVSVTVKALGDWTSNVKSLRPGRRIYIDGPHGDFSMDLHQAPGYVFIAGGVGITPLYSMISSMCVREDIRPAILFYANRDWEGVIFREQLEEMTLYMPNLKIVYVLQEPPSNWRGETGRITAQLLSRYLPRKQYHRFEYFVCGPESLMDAMEATLPVIGVPNERVHTERFAMV
jgi:predicted ferric reductase